mgnify:CR=1 FL=1
MPDVDRVETTSENSCGWGWAGSHTRECAVLLDGGSVGVKRCEEGEGMGRGERVLGKVTEMWDRRCRDSIRFGMGVEGGDKLTYCPSWTDVGTGGVKKLSDSRSV